MSKELGTVPQQLAKVRSFIDGYFFGREDSASYQRLVQLVDRVGEAYQREIDEMLRSCEECELKRT